jgi:hypothetical protein
MEHPQISDRFVLKMLGKSENHPKMMVYHGFPIIFPSFSHHFLYDFMVISPKKNAWPIWWIPSPGGYEGSGNGFLVRAVPRLRQARPGLQMQQLSSAWRWTEGCPLEATATTGDMVSEWLVNW